MADDTQTTITVPTLPDDVREANTAANQANAVTGVYGISGGGKSSLADTAAEYCFDAFGKITLCYAMDLGGFGNKRISLIHNGIMRVYDPSNHVDPFATMELLSLGAWPLELIDPERGFADPHVPLILPRRVVHVVYCPQGHVARREEDMAKLTTSQAPCPTCGVAVTLQNALRVEKQIVRHKLFADVGLRIYDSFTAMNDWALSELQYLSAMGKLPVTASGGSALAGADALRSGQFKFATGSQAQVGFVQNRSYGWLRNIRTIPDQVVPAIATFLVEMGKATDESGGQMILGPKIAGNARTGNVPAWLGNCLHATAEQNGEGAMVYRLWLRNHIDTNDPRKVPYIAKHRGVPLDMPDYLEDDPKDPAWTTCSLKKFFTLLDEQLKKLDAQEKARHPNAPGMWAGAAADEEDVIQTIAPSVAGAGGAVPAVTAQVTSGRSLRARTGVRPPAVAAPTPAPVAASVAHEPQSAAATAAAQEPTATPTPSQAASPMTAPASQPSAPPVTPAPSATLSTPQPPAPPVATPAAGATSLRRRIARPPV